MSISIINNYELNASIFLDSRRSIASLDDLKRISQAQDILYPHGFEVFCVQEGSYYVNVSPQGEIPEWKLRLINDEEPSFVSTYSSQKISELLQKASEDDTNIGINDNEPSPVRVYSSQKVESVFAELRQEATRVDDELLDIDTRVDYLEGEMWKIYGFDGSYDSLTNKPTIPSIDGLATKEYVDDMVANGNGLPLLSSICMKNEDGSLYKQGIYYCLDFDLIPKDVTETYYDDISTSLGILYSCYLVLYKDDNLLSSAWLSLRSVYPFVSVGYRTVSQILCLTNSFQSVTYNLETNTRTVEEIYSISSKPSTSSVLTKTNTDEYTPTENYHPTTKKYVDDAIIQSVVGGDIDLSDYATKEYVDNCVNEALDGIGSGDDDAVAGTDIDLTDLVVTNSISMGRKEDTTIGEKSVAVGVDVEASGDTSHAEGANTTASGYASHSEGDTTTASGYTSHAEGYWTIASGDDSHAEGGYTTASGYDSHAEGYETTASGYASHAEGIGTTASGENSHAEGIGTTASGICSHAEGNRTKASSEYQHVQGKYNIEDTTNTYAHIVGNGSSNSARSNAYTLDWDGNAWFAGDITVGEDNKELATKEYVDDNLPHYNETLIFEISGETDYVSLKSNFYFNVNVLNIDETKLYVCKEKNVTFDEEYKYTLELVYNKEDDTLIDENNYVCIYNHKSCDGTQLIEDENSAVLTISGIVPYGMVIPDDGYFKLYEIDKVELDNNCLSSNLIVKNSLTVGNRTGDIGKYSTAEGDSTEASGDYSHAEGAYTTANAYGSHAEGYLTIASGLYSHAEGYYASASGGDSHAEGYHTTASGEDSHAEGFGTTASGNNSHTEGSNTKASSENQHVQGKYNIEDSAGKYAHIVGNGDENARSNAHTLDWDGNAWFAGNVKVGADNKELATKEYVDDNNFSGDYNDLTNKPTIPSIDGLATEEYVDNAVANSSELKINIVNGLTFANAYINYNNGDYVSGGSAYACQEYIPVISGATYEVSGVSNIVRITYYDSSKTYMNQYIDNTPAFNFTPPSDASYIRVHVDSNSNAWQNLSIESEMEDCIRALNNATSGGSGNVDLSSYALKTDLHSHSNKTVIDTITSNMITKWNQSIPFNDTYVSNCNAWLTNGYVKTSANQTSNLPSVCTGSDRWGILFFIAENVTQGTGTQMYFPIDGTYKGRIFTRSLTNMNQSPNVGEWNLLSTFSGNYNDLTNKPTIPSIDGLATEEYVNEEIQKINVTSQLTDYAKKSELPTKVSQLENDKGYLTEHQSLEGLASETYVDNKVSNLVNSAPETLDTLNELAQALGDDPNFATTVSTQIGKKVDKVEGKSLVDDDEIERLANVNNYDDTEVRGLINAKANPSDIPTKTSELTNDSGFLTSIPSEYVTDSELNNKEYATKDYVNETVEGLATEGYVNNRLGGLQLIRLTQSEYDALGVKDSNTLYIII